MTLPKETKKRNRGDTEGETQLKLCDLENDIHEDHDLSAQKPEIVKRLLKLADNMKQDIGNLGQEGTNQRKAGWVEKPEFQLLGKK